ncbi:MAG: TolC family protein [Candidatus Omnitrophica bacterium]|nr:TolC family protein [Candidatus Omnitrophota bacterium]
MINNRFIISVTLLTVLGHLNVPTACAATEMAQRKRQLQETEAQFTGTVREPQTEELRTLREYVSTGLQRNPTVRAAFYEWKSSVQRISQEFSLPDPQFTYTEYIDEVETRVGPQQSALSIKQMLPFGDKLWIRKSKAFRESEAAYFEFVRVRQDLVNQIAEAYYEFAYLAKAVLITQENMNLLRNFEKVAQSKYSSGLSKNQDLLKIQVELGKLENEQTSLEDLRAPLAIRLRALLNLPDSISLSWPLESLENIATADDAAGVDDLISRMKSNNPQLQAMKERVAGAEEQVKLARRAAVPDVTIGLTQIETGNAINSTTSDSGKDPFMVSLTVNVPIWFHRIHADTAKARADLAAVEYRRAGQETQLVSRLAMAHYQLRDARRQAALYKDALIPKAVQILNATKSAYESGNMDFLNLIDAQRMLLNFQLAYYRYNAIFYQKIYAVQTLIGEIEQYELLQGDPHE